MSSWTSSSALSYITRVEVARERRLQRLTAESLVTSETGPDTWLLQNWPLVGYFLLLSGEIVKITYQILNTKHLFLRIQHYTDERGSPHSSDSQQKKSRLAFRSCLEIFSGIILIIYFCLTSFPTLAVIFWQESHSSKKKNPNQLNKNVSQKHSRSK